MCTCTYIYIYIYTHTTTDIFIMPGSVPGARNCGPQHCHDLLEATDDANVATTTTTTTTTTTNTTTNTNTCHNDTSDTTTTTNDNNHNDNNSNTHYNDTATTTTTTTTTTHAHVSSRASQHSSMRPTTIFVLTTFVLKIPGAPKSWLTPLGTTYTFTDLSRLSINNYGTLDSSTAVSTS